MLGTLAFVAVAPAVTGQTPATPPAKAATPAAPSATNKGTGMDMGKGMGTGGGDMRGSMMGMMKSMESMQMTGNADRDFASMMKIHHQGAIEMAQEELKNGKDAQMRALAKRVISAQQKEIKEIDGWLAKQK
jgi:uncharacterized protein (DUF305 family)